MKKIINILTLILFVGSFTSLTAQTFFKTGQNDTDYTTDQTTNHIFTMSQDGDQKYVPITINVSLNKYQFTNGTTSVNYGWNSSNDIPADWDFEILSVNQTPSSISADKHSFTYSGDPIVYVGITVRIFDNNGTINGLSSVQFKYHLEGIFTISKAEFIACSG